MNRRFTFFGGKGIEELVSCHLRQISEEVIGAFGSRSITGIVLGGGYGRGEGGVYYKGGHERPYNDYDLFVFTSGRVAIGGRRLARRLSEVGQKLENSLGIHVDFGMPISVSKIPKLPFTLMMMELQAGHCVIHGPVDILEGMPRFHPENLPLIEGSRLLMNRAAGLLLARRRLVSAGSDESTIDFVVRNIQKAFLAAGDAILIRWSLYSPSCVERGNRLRGLRVDMWPHRESLYEYYSRAVSFKLLPNHTVPSDYSLSEWLQSAVATVGGVHLWFEEERLGVPGMDWEEYIALPWRARSGSRVECFANAVRNLAAGVPARVGLRATTRPVLDILLTLLPRAVYGQRRVVDEVAFMDLWHRFCA